MIGKSKAAASASAAAEAGVMKKPDDDWQKSSMKKTDFEVLRA